MLKHKARKRFGQNFLHDQHTIERIIQAIKPIKDDIIVEIGPGQAALTKPLIEKVGHIHAVEIDRDLYAYLQTQFTQQQLTLHNVDALKFNFSELSTQAFRIVGNLPYNISTPILFHLLTHKEKVQDMHFMLQKEVVERMAAPPGNKTYGRLSVILQYHCKVDYLFTVKPGAFTPAPAVDSAIVRLTPYKQAPVDVGSEPTFEKLVTQSFAQRRKTLRNNLKSLLSEADIQACNIDPNLRPEQLSLNDFALLAQRLHKKSQCT